MPSLDIPPPDWKGLHQLGHQRLQILLLLRQLITPGKEQLWRVFWVAFFFFLCLWYALNMKKWLFYSYQFLLCFSQGHTDLLIEKHHWSASECSYDKATAATDQVLAITKQRILLAASPAKHSEESMHQDETADIPFSRNCRKLSLC